MTVPSSPVAEPGGRRPAAPVRWPGAVGRPRRGRSRRATGAAGRVAEPAEAAGGVDEGVLQGVGGLLLVAEDRPAVVVEPVGVAVVDQAPGVPVAGAGGGDEAGVIHGGGR